MKTILITGSTDGIGKLTAIQLAKEGHKVYIHGRNKQKLENTVTEIKQISNNNYIESFLADFSDLKSVQQMASEVNAKLPQLDVLINNAGIFKNSVTKNNNDIDIRLVVNYLAPFVLTKNLIQLLRKSEHSRIINLSSAAQATVSINALQGNSLLSVQDAYSQSKLALTMWSFYLALQYPKIVIIAVNPGSLLNTKMANEAYGTHWASADKGVTILHDLAVAEKYKGITGKYFDNDKGDPIGSFANAHSDAYNHEKIDALIATTEKLINDIL
ncbi:SDR family NAD(P)-dependent oxidoreductase [Tenacibaculum amylolyticum]|uniref:SDR family NAD(P)-dependent oxidoreductase n=1 Tax=Tenacibaculum amylolyticum TaxID=104269 RepID=UPI0038964840